MSPHRGLLSSLIFACGLSVGASTFAVIDVDCIKTGLSDLIKADRSEPHGQLQLVEKTGRSQPGGIYIKAVYDTVEQKFIPLIKNP